jgi:putative ABC transport system permease protein
MVILRLAISGLRVHRVRVALTASAIALSLSLVIAVTSGYASIEAAAHRLLSQFMGTVDAQITRRNDPRGGVPMSLASELADDPAVRTAVPRLELEVGLLDSAGVPVPGRPAQIVGIQRPQDVHVERMQIVRGAWFETSDAREAVIDQVLAERLKLDVGQELLLPGMDSRLMLRIVGIVHKPGILASHIQTVYVPLHTLQRYAQGDAGDQVSRIMLDLRGEPAEQEAFAERWRKVLEQRDPLLRLRLSSQVRQEMEKHLLGLQIVSYLAGTVSMLAAGLIVFASLSMGVSERQRTLAMLRAIGMQRRGVGLLVIADGLVLSAIGSAAGVPLGWLWVYLLSLIPAVSQVLVAGIVLSVGGTIAGVCGSVLAALLASLMPAWAAMRVDPLKAMTPLAAAMPARVPIRAAVAGLLLISIDPLLVQVPWHLIAGPAAEWVRAIRFYGHFGVGLPALLLGFFLLAPLIVLVSERLFGPVVARLMGVPRELLKQQLSTGLWRAAGTCTALMVGLAILIVLQTQGQSAIKTWRLPDRFPDVFITAPPFGALDAQQQARLASVPGIRQLMPIAITSPRFSNPMFAVLGAAVLPDATMFFGVDPDIALDMMDLDFREGSPEQARAMLRLGRHVLVTDEFRQLKGLGVGQKIRLTTPLHGDVDYTIAGVIWPPGMDVIVSLYDLGRQADQRTAGSLFGTLTDAANDFGATTIQLFAATLEHSIDKQQLLDRMQRDLGVMGMKVGDVRHIKAEIQHGLGNLLRLVSTVALGAMAVASLGVTNTVMASIRTRRWQFGVLRSIGVTRSQLLRIVLGEALVLGGIACGMGLLAGGELVLNARASYRLFIGFSPPLQIPWGMILVGSGVVITVSLLASVVPALSVSRAEPLSLLQAGRATA